MNIFIEMIKNVVVGLIIILLSFLIAKSKSGIHWTNKYLGRLKDHQEISAIEDKELEDNPKVNVKAYVSKNYGANLKRGYDITTWFRFKKEILTKVDQIIFVINNEKEKIQLKINSDKLLKIINDSQYGKNENILNIYINRNKLNENYVISRVGNKGEDRDISVEEWNS
jgi:hypothetical protein